MVSDIEFQKNLSAMYATTLQYPACGIKNVPIDKITYVLDSLDIQRTWRCWAFYNKPMVKHDPPY